MKKVNSPPYALPPPPAGITLIGALLVNRNSYTLILLNILLLGCTRVKNPSGCKKIVVKLTLTMRQRYFCEKGELLPTFLLNIMLYVKDSLIIEVSKWTREQNIYFDLRK